MQIFNGVDFHCHLDLYPDHEAAVAAAEAAGIYTLAVTTTPKAWPRNRDLAKNLRYVRPALGFHPQLVAERADELSLWESLVPQARYIGEVGLDAGPKFYKSLEMQKRIFRTVLERCAEDGEKILTVHSVRSVPTVLDMIEESLPLGQSKVVLHWFTGTVAQARRASDLGCFFSINAQMTRSDRGRILIAELQKERILTETDGPFTQVEGRAACPTDVHLAIEGIADILNSTPNAVLNMVRENLKVLLGPIR